MASLETVSKAINCRLPYQTTQTHSIFYCSELCQILICMFKHFVSKCPIIGRWKGGGSEPTLPPKFLYPYHPRAGAGG